MNTNENCACYTFYSYKGGSGRSTTLINTIPHLIKQLGASPQEPILIVDADLESAGLTYFFKAANKFSDLFNDSINTTKILLHPNDYLKPSAVKADRVFGSIDAAEAQRIRTQNLSVSLIDKLHQAFSINQQLFDGIFFTRKELEMFEEIVAFGTDDNSENSLKIEHLKKLFPLKDEPLRYKGILDTLENIENSNRSEEEKLQAKQEAMNNFLPTETLLDISAYFDAEPMTVRLLGVDARSRDASLLSVGSGDDNNIEPSIIKMLIQTCRKRHYKAVVFDSACGTQNTPYILHEVSDILVYCLRPSRQFLDGTETQLSRYEEILKSKNQNSSSRKQVILLPTAVPVGEVHLDDNTTIPFRKRNIRDIEVMATTYQEIVDKSFCSPDQCLNEVELFKWYEMILGTSNAGQVNDELSFYCNGDTIPAEDARKAYATYAKLAEKMIANTRS